MGKTSFIYKAYRGSGGIMAFLSIVMLLAPSLLLAQPVSDSKFPLFDSAAIAQHHCPFDFVVWLNTKTDTYYLNGPQPGDNKADGAYMCQRDADQMDYHAAQSRQ